MKKCDKLILILLLFICTNADSQKLYEVCFNACIGLPMGPNLTGIKTIESVDKNGSVSLFIGDAEIPMQSFNLVRIDSNGTLNWNKNISLNANDTLFPSYLIPSDIISFNEDYIICSFKDSTIADTVSIQLLRTDSSGNLIWSKEFYTPSASYPVKILADYSNSSIYCLSVKFNNLTDRSFYQQPDSIFYLTKFNANGNLTWLKEFTGLNAKINALDFIFNNNALYIGSSTANNFSMLKADTSGTILWSKDYDPGSKSKLVSLIKNSNNIAACINRSLQAKPVILSIDENSNILNAKSFTSDTTFTAKHFFRSSENRFIIIETASTSINTNAYLERTSLWTVDSTNNFLQHVTLDSSIINLPSQSSADYYALNYFANNKGIIAGMQGQYSSHLSSFISKSPFIIQLDSIGNGCFYHPRINTQVNINSISVNVSSNSISNLSYTLSETESNIVIYDSLLSAYTNCITYAGINESAISITNTFINPNPFSNSTVFNVKGLNSKINTLKIFNSLGANIRTEIITEEETIIDRGSLATGVYFYQLSNNNAIISTGKFIIR